MDTTDVWRELADTSLLRFGRGCGIPFVGVGSGSVSGKRGRLCDAPDCVVLQVRPRMKDYVNMLESGHSFVANIAEHPLGQTRKEEGQ